jgi:hypothetical protein
LQLYTFGRWSTGPKPTHNWHTVQNIKPPQKRSRPKKGFKSKIEIVV